VIVTEVLMRPGSFRLDLSGDPVQGAPSWILDELREALGWTGDPDTWTVSDGHIVVTAAPMPAHAMSLDAALYTGRLTKQLGVHSFEGDGLAAWFGAPSKPGPFKDATITGTSDDLDDWIDKILAVGTTGITKGTITEPGGTLTSTWYWTTIAEQLDLVASALSAEWRINPDGTLDAGPAVNLFTDPPEVVITASDGGEVSGALRGITGRVSSPAISAESRTSQVRVVGAGSGNAAVISATTKTQVWRNIAGGNPDLERAVDAPQSRSAEAAALAAATKALFLDPRFSFAVDVDSDRLRDYLQPGDSVYVYDPAAGIIGADHVTYRGPIFPVTVRVQKMVWNVTEGHGVYLRRHDGSDAVYTDLTPYVQWPQAGCALTVGNGQGDGDNAVGGAARF